MFVARDRHFGDVCHVFECVDQSPRSLAAALNDVIVTSREEDEEGEANGENKTSRQRPRFEKKKRDHTFGGSKIEKLADDHNNNSIAVGMFTRSGT